MRFYRDFMCDVPDEGIRRIRASFREEKFQRLVALKDRYVPTNVFSRNVNIRPAARPKANVHRS